ncbi:hypothetical protein CW304_23075 [Bacillus sp. UFRGS-B20]|nr:hypothetical protein CW304_23075 [Bacillus sp. UFRGS-B20]
MKKCIACTLFNCYFLYLLRFPHVQHYDNIETLITRLVLHNMTITNPLGSNSTKDSTMYLPFHHSLYPSPY